MGINQIALLFFAGALFGEWKNLMTVVHYGGKYPLSKSCFCIWSKLTAR